MRINIPTVAVAAGVSMLSLSLSAATLTSLSGKGSITDEAGNVKVLVENQALVKGDRVFVKEGTVTISGCGDELTLKANESVKVMGDNKCGALINLATGAGLGTSTAAASTGAVLTALPYAKLFAIAGGLGVVAAIANDDSPASP